MIKFFRHIRKSLLMENKTSKYFKYAIGEILLVMIGILLALQVNNWNNNRLDVIKEQMFLKNLQEHFKTNLAEQKRIYIMFTEGYQASVNLLEFIKGDLELTSGDVESLIDNMINKTQSLDMYSGSIDEIINTGSLNIIRDPKLRKQLSNWSFQMDDYRDDIDIMNNYLFGFIIPSLTKKAILRNTKVPSHFTDELEISKISRSGFSIDYHKTLRTLEFENEVYNNTLNYMYSMNSYKVLENYLKETLKLIELNME